MTLIVNAYLKKNCWEELKLLWIFEALYYSATSKDKIDIGIQFSYIIILSGY